MTQKNKKQTDKENPMKEIKIEKIILGIGGTADYLEKGVKLLKILTNKKPSKRKTRKRIPSLGIRPKLEVGAIVTIRKNKEEMLKKFLAAINYSLKKSQVSENTFSFGVNEYIEIPGMEYQRDIGMMGFDVTVVITRPGKRVGLKKNKKGKIPKRHRVSKQEIIKFMEDNYNVKFR
ncbi:MAG TPA: 50S ribosomal protein L5 [Candidatus Nanoarchaeia archaeon]|nr:50S ribosomal protein L5 [Candidatus Nanoarchaeia archaeon]